MSIEGLNFHHLGVAVNNLDKARDSMANLFGYQTVSGPFFDEIQDVTVEFLGRPQATEPLIELVAPGSADSPVSTYLKKGIGAYHICYEVTDLEKAIFDSRANGCILLGKPQPAVAFDGRAIAWLYTPARCLIELLQK